MTTRILDNQNAQHWIVARTIVRRETSTAQHIADAGFEIFAPRIKLSRTAKITALFPGYLFVRIESRWRIIAKTIGVLSLIMSGDQPARCPASEISRIKSMMQPDGFVRLPKAKKIAPIPVGQAVRVVAGPFAGFDAIYDGMSKQEREFVLLEILGRKTRVEITPGDSSPLVSAITMEY